MRSLALIGGLCSLLTLWASMTASAATVSLRPDPNESATSEQVFFVASGGERNRVHVRFALIESDESVATWTVSDSGARLWARAPCVSVDRHTATCTTRSQRLASDFDVYSARLELGDLDDELGGSHRRSPKQPSWVPWKVFVHGGEGDDRLHGSARVRNRLYGEGGDDVLVAHRSGDELLDGGIGDDLLRGGPSFDVLRGGGGRDELHGAGGSDYLIDGDLDGAPVGAGPDSDVLNGGPGNFDRVSYKRRFVGVVVDEAGGRPDGRDGERDQVSGFEAITGGQGDDRLVGTAGPNTLRGLRGRDELVGRGSADQLEPGRGDNAVFCGAGDDTVDADSRSLDFLGSACEKVLVGMEVSPYPARVRPRAMTFRLSCGEDEEEDDTASCSGRIRLREASGKRRLLATGAFPLGQWSDRPVKVRFTPIGRQLAVQPGGIMVSASLRGFRNHLAYRWRIRLRMNP